MSEHEGQPVPQETIAIGGDPDAGDSPSWWRHDEEPPAEDDFVAVFLEDEDDVPADEPEALLDWLRRLDRNRLVLAGGLAASLVALNVALVGWATRPPEPAAGGSAFESHGLTADQAACFAFARIENRVELVTGPNGSAGTGLLKRVLRAEVRQLDALAADYPTADYRLIVDFGAVADLSTGFLEADVIVSFGGDTGAHVDAVATARDSCLVIAGFDTERSALI